MTANSDHLPPDWTSVELEKTVKNDFGVGADSDLPPQTRFLRSIAQLVRRRLANIDEGKGRVAVFLLSSEPPASVQDKCARVPMLDNGLTKLDGNFWFVSEVAMAGNALPIPDEMNDDKIFKFVVEELALGTTQAIVLDLRLGQPTVRHYHNGLADLETCNIVEVSGVVVTFKEIFESVDRTYKEGLVTPIAQGSGGALWGNPNKFFPISDAEQKIQFALKIGLANAFPTCTVREEQGMPSGRLDLEIEEADPINRSKLTRHAVLELKVLRSFYSSGTAVSAKKIKDWVHDGVIQADEYRKDRGALAASLCCFDMRTADTKSTCFDHVLKLASEKDVVLRRWFLFNDAAKYRASRAA